MFFMEISPTLPLTKHNPSGKTTTKTAKHEWNFTNFIYEIINLKFIIIIILRG